MFDNCNNINDALVAVIGLNLPSLGGLTLHNNHQITDAALIEIAQHYKQLSVLVVKWCNKISDAGIAVIAEGCKDLTYLDFSENYQLTNKSIDSILTCSNLSQICVVCNQCPLITEGKRQQLKN